MRLKTKNIVRTPKQSLFFFIFIMTLILGSLIYIFVKNRTSSLPNDFYNNVKNEIEEDAQSIESDIKTEIERRQIDGVIHYVQAFCHRGIADIVFRDAFDMPILTLEGNDDFFLNSHVRTRIEAFLDMLQRNRYIQQSRQALKS